MLAATVNFAFVTVAVGTRELPGVSRGYEVESRGGTSLGGFLG